ncbi:hypothetical protein [Mesorhizobium sp. M00.F.Ca.ET.216.01.1.1]|uniref:hypothetical protein n=1 Tax=Mesorhizobium sp. M00.F.Ca.ET.216.01.1.1 TaxID=2500528 RepID=UPI000FDBC67C|nr:hypothetical protein [Mesorhizobium sp. M00.F.Ca.ET.216.01.1.1]TGQ36516.1 hypothetical protein EN859_021910 [Mesorhizobium sp. M00.F.Ca.ET.216.01.1.1]
MADAEEVAKLLAYEFLREGRYSAAHGPVEVRSLAQAVAVADADEVIEEARESFGGIVVQSVGYEVGKDNPSVHIYLMNGSQKLIKSLPKSVDGVPIKGHRMGPVTVRPDAASSSTNHGYLFERNNRIACGSSCAPTSESSTGTLGALVRRNGSQNIYLLSNNHVLAGCNHVPSGQPVLSPSSSDGRPTMRAPGEVGRHELIHELRSGDPNFVNPCDSDLALARATNPALLTSWQGDVADGYDTPTNTSTPLSGMAVKKFGRTTGLTRGFVEALVPTPIPIGYNSKNFKGVVWFQDVWTVHSTTDAFALPGDSGSLVVTEDGSAAVGLVFAASRNGDYAWIIPMPSIVNSFGGLALVGGHGI